MKTQKAINGLSLYIVGIIPLLCWPFTGSFNAVNSKFVGLMALLIAAIALVVLNRHRITIKELFARENLPFYVFFLFLILSGVFAQDPGRALLGSTSRRDGVLTFFAYGACYFVCRYAKGISSKAFPWIIISASVVALLGILQSYQIDPSILRFYSKEWEGRAFSVMGNENFLGAYLVIVLPIAMHQLFYKRKLWALIPYSLIFLCLLCTQTRGSWIGAFIGYALFFVLAYRAKGSKKRLLRFFIALTILSLIILLFYAFTSQDPFMQRILSIFIDLKGLLLNDPDAEHAGSQRVYIWKKVMGLIPKKPVLGYGMDNLTYAMKDAYYDEIFKEYGRYRNFDKAHNEYLNIAVSSGVPSLILYLTYIGLILKKGFSHAKTSPEHRVLIVALLGYSVQAFFNIQMIVSCFMFFAFLGLLSNQKFRSSRVQPTSSYAKPLDLSIISP